LFTTPTEYAQFLIEMMDPDRTAHHSLKQPTLTKMLTPTVDANADREFGLGWWRVKSSAGTVFGHSGSNGSGFRCCSRFEPAANRGLVIMCNSTGGKTLYQTLLERIEQGRKKARQPVGQ